MNMKRIRGRNNRGGGSSSIRHHTGNIPLNRNHVFDSSGPDVRVRGTAQQLFEKYLQLGRDATGVGDRVMAEGYFQHAEHYFRILNAINQAQSQQQQQNGGHYSTRRGEDEMDPADSVSGAGEQPRLEARDIPISATASETSVD